MKHFQKCPMLSDELTYSHYCEIIWLDEKQIDKLEFMFGRTKVFNKNEYYPKYDKYGYKIIRDYFTQSSVMGRQKVKCPVCLSRNILIEKGEGHMIDGAYYIAIICHDCKKVYALSDVKYYPHCPKEL